MDHFDLIAPFYDRLFHVPHPEKLVEILALPTPGVLLDAGGGTGRVSHTLKPYAHQVVVADISRGMCAQAAAKEHLQAVCAPSEHLPFADHTFERILMVDALHHVHHAPTTALELWRVLKPGGRLVIEEPDVRIFYVKIVALLEKLALMRSHFYSPPRIAALFNGTSARITHQQDQYTAWVIVEKPA
ncbi:MAG: methyltransferase domain-containing protein [Anaerolineales bacterium]|jgi:demethylmenaquinone methyltransferase/2-methoxy-6-polyprenyl-1,4-benzoquinol methylase|nr:methyltransferase domain-containing protein [Anaerolineales bacterium]